MPSFKLLGKMYYYTQDKWVKAQQVGFLPNRNPGESLINTSRMVLKFLVSMQDGAGLFSESGHPKGRGRVRFSISRWSRLEERVPKFHIPKGSQVVRY